MVADFDDDGEAAARAENGVVRRRKRGDGGRTPVEGDGDAAARGVFGAVGGADFDGLGAIGEDAAGVPVHEEIGGAAAVVRDVAVVETDAPLFEVEFVEAGADATEPPTKEPLRGLKSTNLGARTSTVTLMGATVL